MLNVKPSNWITDELLWKFQEESNRIENIEAVKVEEYEALKKFIKSPLLTVDLIKEYIAVCAPHAEYRDLVSVPGVRVEKHRTPPSGPNIHIELLTIIDKIYLGQYNAWEATCQYLHIHPFTDGNGRSSRALWLWMTQDARWGFLREFFYQTLEQYDRSVANASR